MIESFSPCVNCKGVFFPEYFCVRECWLMDLIKERIERS
jgi:hypothetical protein